MPTNIKESGLEELIVDSLAIIIDEAHSSQSGNMSAKMNAVLSTILSKRFGNGFSESTLRKAR